MPGLSLACEQSGVWFTVRETRTGPASMLLSPHFSLQELTVSAWAKGKGVSTVPTSAHEWDNIKFLAAQLEQVRTVLGGNPLLISSAFRNDLVNSAAGGVPSSAHRLALAADFTCPGFGSVTTVCEAIAASDLQFDQLIWEYGRWIHIGYKRNGARRQLLTKRVGKGYVAGLPH